MNGSSLLLSREEARLLLSEERGRSLLHPLTRETAQLQIGDCVEIQTGYFSCRKVEVVGFPKNKPGWVEVKQKDWQITKEYQSSDLRLVQKRTAR